MFRLLPPSILVALLICLCSAAHAQRPVISVGKPALTDLAYSPDGRHLAVTTPYYTELLDAQDYHVRARLPAVPESDRRLSFSADGDRLCVSGFSLDLWDVESLTRIVRIPKAAAGVVSPDGQHVVYWRTPNVHVWDVVAGEITLELAPGPPPEPWDGWPKGLAFHPTRPWLAARYGSPTVHMWDLETGALVRLIELRTHPRGFTFSPDGRWLAAEASGLTIFGMDQERPEAFEPTSDMVNYGFAFAPDGMGLVTGSSIGQAWDSKAGWLRVLSVPGLSEVNRLPLAQSSEMPGYNTDNSIRGISMHPDGSPAWFRRRTSSCGTQSTSRDCTRPMAGRPWRVDTIFQK